MEKLALCFQQFDCSVRIVIDICVITYKVIELEPANSAAQREMSVLKHTQMYEQSAMDSYEKGDYRKVRPTHFY